MRPPTEDNLRRRRPNYIQSNMKEGVKRKRISVAITVAFRMAPESMWFPVSMIMTDGAPIEGKLRLWGLRCEQEAANAAIVPAGSPPQFRPDSFSTVSPQRAAQDGVNAGRASAETRAVASRTIPDSGHWAGIGMTSALHEMARNNGLERRPPPKKTMRRTGYESLASAGNPTNRDPTAQRQLQPGHVIDWIAPGLIAPPRSPSGDRRKAISNPDRNGDVREIRRHCRSGESAAKY